MCIFSGAVESVNATRIFGRMTDDGVQYLVYQMDFSAEDEVAMILPFPCDKDRGEPEFINLEEFPGFFKGLDKQFPKPRTRGGTRGMMSKGISFSAPLAVHNVGAFEGSFVPTIEDFGRLDRRFQLPTASLDVMKVLYADFSFAVFKLKAGADQKVHPMAFKFPSAQLDTIFFPTVHVHDGGSVPEKETFDHALYVQVPSDKLERDLAAYKRKSDSRVEISPHSLTRNMPEKLQRAHQGILADARGFKVTLKGHYPNQDMPWSLDD